MTGDIDGIAIGLAEIGTGSAVAGAIERERGAAQSGTGGQTGEAQCLNCGATLAGPHCHSCGQRAHVHRTLGAFFHDLLHGVLHFEGKTWRTLPMLVWQPGRLTREYIDGRRARYVSPIALFLFVVFLSFGLFSALGSGDPVVQSARKTQVEMTEADRAEMREGVERARSEFVEGFDAASLPKDSSLAKGIAHVRENPQLAIYKAQTNAYKFSWMLIPLSVPFVWLLFPFNRRFKGYDHTVFVTYSIAFMIALVALVSLLIYLNAGAGLLLLFYAPFHMYRQLRGTYSLSRFGAIWRMLVLSLFAWVAIGLFASAITWLAAT